MISTSYDDKAKNVSYEKTGVLRSSVLEHGYDLRASTLHDSVLQPPNVYHKSMLAFMVGFMLIITVTQVSVVVLSWMTRLWWSRQSLEARRRFIQKVYENQMALYFTGAAVLGLFAGILLYNTETDSKTGRRRLFIYNDAQLSHDADNYVNYFLQNLASKGILLDTSDPAYNRTSVMFKSLLAANSNDYAIEKQRWHVVLIKSDTVNAFIFPNGFLFMNTGMLDDTNDDQLMMVFGHEMSHCLQRHVNQLSSVDFLCRLFLLIPISVIWATVPVSLAMIMHTAVIMAVNLLIKLPYSRFLEHEADRDGLMYAARACVDVYTCCYYWVRAAYQTMLTNKTAVYSWMSEHPTHLSRALHLQSLIPEAIKVRKSANCNEIP